MSYVKSLKKSPFKTFTITLGKLPDGGIYQSVFITQDEEPTYASFDCSSHAPSEERKGFLPLVKEALKRAQSMEELTDLLKPSAEGRPRAGGVDPGEGRQRQGTLKAQLLNLMKNDNHQQAVEAVLNSGLLPEPQLRQWLNQLVERAIRRVLGRSGCPEWEEWATKYLSGEDRSADAAWAATWATAWAAAAAAREARAAAAAASWAVDAAVDAADASVADASVADVAVWTASWAARATTRAAEERKAQYDDLLNLINDL